MHGAAIMLSTVVTFHTVTLHPGHGLHANQPAVQYHTNNLSHLSAYTVLYSYGGNGQVLIICGQKCN